MSLITPKFEGKFKWRAFRKQLMSLRQDAMTIQKLAGENIKVNPYPGKGSVVDVQRERPEDEEPPDITCQLPAGDDDECPHAFCIMFKGIRPETLYDDWYWDRGVIAYFGSVFTFNIQPYFFYDGEDDPPNDIDWVAGLSVSGWPFINIEVPMTPDDFFNNFHAITFQFSHINSTQWRVDVTGYGSSIVSDTGTISSPAVYATLFVGSYFASNIEPIDLKGIQLIANPDSEEEDFIFPDDSFDSTVGSGQSISGDTVTITGDSSGTTIGYIKNLDPAHDLECFIDCPVDETICVTFAGIEACECKDSAGYQYTFDDSVLNGTYELTKTIDLLDVQQWEGDGPTVNVQRWNTDEACEEDADDSCSVLTHIVIQCRRTSSGGDHTILFWASGLTCLNSFATYYFFNLSFAAGVLVFEVSEANGFNCGTSEFTGAAGGTAFTELCGEEFAPPP